MTPETCNSPDTEAHAVNVALNWKAVVAASAAADRAYMLSDENGVHDAAVAAIKTYLSATAPALPQDVAKLIAEYRPSMPVEVLHLWAEDVKAALASQSAALASAREVIEQVAEGSIDASATAIIIGWPTARTVLDAAREWKGR